MVADNVTDNKIADKTRAFDALYRQEHESHFTAERTRLEVDTLVAVLDLNPSERILDLGCGWGRHLRELKERNFTSLVGVDVHEAFLESVSEVELIAGDVAKGLELPYTFDAVYCAFNALFAVPDDATRVLEAVAKLLRPGGRFLFDTTNRERLVAENPGRSWRGGEALPWLLEETYFDLLTGAQRIRQQRIFADGRSEMKMLTRYHYTLAELVKLFHNAGLSVHDVYGDWQLNTYTAQIPRMMLVSRKD